MEGGVEVEIAELITILCDCVCGFVMEKLCRNTKVKYFFLEREGAMESYKIERTTRVRCRLLYNALEHEKLRDK